MEKNWGFGTWILPHLKRLCQQTLAASALGSGEILQPLSWHYIVPRFPSRAHRLWAAPLLQSVRIQTHTCAVFRTHHHQWDGNTDDVVQRRPQEIISWIISFGEKIAKQTSILHSCSLEKGPKFPPSSWWIHLNSLKLSEEKSFRHEEHRMHRSINMLLGKPYTLPYGRTQQHGTPFIRTIYNDEY